MTAVRIDGFAFSDERFEELARYAGLADADHARGKMAQLWRQCTLEGSETVSNQMVIRLLNQDGIQALIRSRLGEPFGADRMRIKGTLGRIEWLSRLRSNGAKGGRPKNKGSKPKGSRADNQMGKQTNNPPTPTPTLALTLSPALAPQSEHGHPGERIPSPLRGVRKGNAIRLPDDWNPSDAHRELAKRRDVDLPHEADKFRAHAEAHDRRCVRWNAAFTQWLLNARPTQRDALAHVLAIARGDIP